MERLNYSGKEKIVQEVGGLFAAPLICAVLFFYCFSPDRNCGRHHRYGNSDKPSPLPPTAANEDA